MFALGGGSAIALGGDLPLDRDAPIAGLFRRRPSVVALVLVAGLALTGVVGRITYDVKGFPGRFPPQVTRVFDYDVNGAQGSRLMQCFYQRDDRAYPLAEERERVARFFEAGRCAVADDPAKPIILVVGNSMRRTFSPGLTDAFGRTANILTLSSVFCVPLVEHVEMDAGVAGTPRCRAINDYVFERIRAIKPDVLLVGGYLSEYDHEANWRYLQAFSTPSSRAARSLHRNGVRSIVVAGEVPTWAPWLPILVGRDLLETGERAGVLPRRGPASSFETNRRSRPRIGRRRNLPVSQATTLCGADGCRRRGPICPRICWLSTMAITASMARSSR